MNDYPLTDDPQGRDVQPDFIEIRQAGSVISYVHAITVVPPLAVVRTGINISEPAIVNLRVILRIRLQTYVLLRFGRVHLVAIDHRGLPLHQHRVVLILAGLERVFDLLATPVHAPVLVALPFPRRPQIFRTQIPRDPVTVSAHAEEFPDLSTLPSAGV